MRRRGGRRALPHQLSRKLLSVLDRLGCLSLRSALASIWRMRSRVNENCWPTSCSVWSLFMSLGQLDRNEGKIAAAITFVDEAAAARA
jgi:hypothetical protein